MSLVAAREGEGRAPDLEFKVVSNIDRPGNCHVERHGQGPLVLKGVPYEVAAAVADALNAGKPGPTLVLARFVVEQNGGNLP